MLMRWISGGVFFVLVTMGAGCSSELQANNPFDPETPPNNQAPARAEGTVFARTNDGSDPAPLGSAHLSLLRADRTEPLSYDTTVDGAFAFEDLQPGTYLLDISHASHLSQSREFELGPGETRTLPLLLDPIPTVVGADSGAITGVIHLEGELAKPAAAQDHSGILVEVVGEGVRTPSAKDGRFDLVLAPGEYSLRISARNHADHLTPDPLAVTADTVTELSTLATPVVLLALPGAIVGNILLENVDPAEPTYPTDLPGSGVNVALLGANDGPTAADGSYRVTAPAGAYVLAVSRAGWVTDDSRMLTIEGGVDLSVPTIRLRASRGSVAGQVALEGRADHAGALASLTGTTYSATSTPTGEFEIRAVPVGTYELVVQRDGFRTRTVGSVTVNQDLAADVGSIDLFRQQGQFAINGGAEFTNDPLVTLSLGNQTAVAMRISHDETFTDPAQGETTFQPFAQTPTFSLIGGDGTKTVYVQYQDAAGSNGPAFSSSIVLDTTPPQTVAVLADQGAAYTNDAGAIVSLELPAIDAPAAGADRASGVAEMRISNDPTFTGSNFVPYELSRVWTLLDPGNDGVKTVHVEYRDRAGNVSAPVTDSIEVDRLAPTLVASSFLISGGDAYTRRGNVVLALSSPDATRMAFSQAAGFPVKVFEPYAPARLYELLPGDGTKDVYLILMDEAGNEAGPFQATIVLDTTEPGNVTLGITGSIADGATSPVLTGSRTVALSIGGTDANGLDQMWIANDAAFVSASPESFATSSPAWSLPGGTADGPVSIYLLVSDLAGNFSRTVATITLDTSPPDLPTVAITQAPHTTSATVDLVLGAVGASQMFIFGDVAAAANTGAWIPYQTTQQIPLLAAPEGAKAVNVIFRDAAGNETVSVSASTSLDTQAPTGTGITLEGTIADGATSASLTRTIGINASPVATGATEVMLANDASFSGGVWFAYAPGVAVSWNLLPGDGSGKVVWARFRDAAGNLATSQSLPIELDTIPPGSAAIVAASGEPYTGTASISVRPTATAADEMRLSTDGVFDGLLAAGPAAPWENWGSYNTTASVTLPSGDGAKTVYAVFRDLAGNESPAATDDLELDTSAPQSPALRIEENAAGFVSTVAITVRPDVDATNNAFKDIEMRLSTDGALDTEPWVAYIDTALVVLPGGDCVAANCKEVCTEFRDPAGNTSGSVCETTTLDGTPPTTPALVTPAETVNTSGTNYDLVIAAPVDDDFFDHYEVVVASPSGASLSYSFTDPGLSQTVFTVGITQGGSAYSDAAVNTLRIRGVDLAGNHSSDAVALVTEDSGVPVAPTLVNLSDTVVNADTQLVYLDRSDQASDDATFSHFETAVSTGLGCPPTGPEWAATSSTQTFTFQLRQGNGVDCSSFVPCIQRLCVKAVDGAGNEGPSSLILIREDSIPPTTPSASPRTATVNAPSVDVRLDTLAVDSTAISYEVLGGQYGSYTTSPTQDHFSFDLAQDQVSDLCVRARDEADNLSVPDCVEVTEKSTIRVTASDYHEIPAAMHGDWVLYERHQLTAPGNASWIYFKNVATDEEIYIGWGSRARMAVTSATYWFVWDTDADSGSVTGDIYLQGRSFSDPWTVTTASRNITQWHAPDSSYADTDGRTISFYSNVGEIYRFLIPDLSLLNSGTSAALLLNVSGTEVAQRGATRVRSTLFSSRIFYNVYSAPNYQLYRYYWSAFSGTSRQVITNDRAGLWEVSSRHLAWTELVGGVKHLFTMPIGGAAGSGVDSGVEVTSLAGLWSPPTVTNYGYTFDALITFTLNQGTWNSEELYLYRLGATSPGPERLTYSPAPKGAPAPPNGGRILFPANSAQANDLFVMDLSETRWLTADPGDQYLPKIDGDVVIWGDNRLGAKDMAVHDLSTATETLITSVEGVPDSFGGAFIGYTYGTSQPLESRVLDVSDPTNPIDTTVSVLVGGGPTAVALGGSRMVWTEYNGSLYAIYRSDLPPPTSKTSVTAFGARLWPDVQYDTVTWTEVSDGFRVHCRNLGTGQTAALDTGFFQALGPAISGPPTVDLVWRDDINAANADLRYCHLTCATSPTCTQIVLEPVGSAPTSFDIGDGIIAWRRESPSGSANVKVLDQSVGAPITLSPFVSRTSTQSEPATQGGRVVFEDDRSGNRDIYLWTAYR